MDTNLLKQIQAEAQSQRRPINDDEGESEGCSSSEEEGELQNNIVVKKVIESIQVSNVHPEPKESESPACVLPPKGRLRSNTNRTVINLK